jgi:serine/threonine-protein kinase
MRPSEPTWGFSAFDLADRLLREQETEPAAPEDFGPYRFPPGRPLLGRGALGDVWLAEERGQLGAGRYVAVKLLRRVADRDLAANEVRSQSRLVNSNIATLYSHGVLEDGTPWLAMEFVDGQPLDEYCRARNCSIHQRVELFHTVCEAVAYAHAENIAHGDLKPPNILVKSDGQPKLLDFGFARRLQNAATGQDPMQAVLGLTPAYAAPEQFQPGSAGFRADIYSLGVILYELLSDEIPFDVSKRTLAEILDLKAGTEQAAAPSLVTKHYKELSRGGWRDLDALCLKAMARDPKERYASVDELLRDLDRFAGYQPLQARHPQPLTYRFGKFIRRYRRAVIAVSLAMLLCTAGVALYTVRLARARNEALAEAARTQRVKQFFLDVFEHAAEDARPAEKIRIANLFLDRGAADARSLSQDPAMQADIYQGLGALYREWGVLDRAENLLRQAVALDETHLPANHAQTLRAKLALGILLEEHGAYEEAIGIGNEVLRVPPARSDYPKALKLLADANFHLGRVASAHSLSLQALEADRKVNGPSRPEIADDLMDLGNLEVSRGTYLEAEKYFRQALAINRAWFGKDSPEAADSATYVAQALNYEGGHEQEESSLLTAALASLEKARGEADFRVAFTLAQMGAAALERKHLDEAEEDYIRAVAIYRTIRGDEHQWVAVELANLASIYLAKKEYPRAEPIFRDVIHRLEKTVPENDVNIGIARIKLGHCLLCQKRYQGAESELLKGYEILNKRAVSSVSWLITARKDLVLVYRGLKQPTKASRFQAEVDANEAASKGSSR